MESHSSENAHEAAVGAAVDDVLAYLVHDLRSPLTVISGYADLAIRGAAQGDVSPFLPPIRRAAADLEERVARLADARDASNGSLHLERSDHDLGAVVGARLDELEPDLSPHPVKRSLAPDVHASVDAERVGQALTDLVVNAAKFAPSDTAIEVALVSSGGSAAISVRDHGPGIPDESRSQLFRRFARIGTRGRSTGVRSEEHPSELQSPMSTSYAFV